MEEEESEQVGEDSSEGVLSDDAIIVRYMLTPWLLVYQQRCFVGCS